MATRLRCAVREPPCEPDPRSPSLTRVVQQRSKSVAATAVLQSLIMLGALAACGGDCVAVPCPLPLAISLTVSSANPGVALVAATVDVTGAELTTFSCSATCPIFGYAGTYDITVSAAGFGTAHQSVQVRGSNPPCGCATTVSEKVTTELSPSPPSALGRIADPPSNAR